jgi:hypothetical protein
MGHSAYGASFSHKNGKNANNAPWSHIGNRPAPDLAYLAKSGVSVYKEMSRTVHQFAPGYPGPTKLADAAYPAKNEDVRRFDQTEKPLYPNFET